MARRVAPPTDATSVARRVGVALGLALSASCTHPGEDLDLALERGSGGGAGPNPGVFIEAKPGLTTAELFGALRDSGVDLQIAEDRRLSVRVHEAARFEHACELLLDLDHDIDLIDLSFLDLEDLDPLVGLRSTARLDLSGARAPLDPLRHLTQLRSLSLASTDYESLAALAELEALERLDLSAARADLVRVGQLVGLRELDLSSARTMPRGFELRDGEGVRLEPLRDLDALERLDLSQTKVRDWRPLAELWTVRELDLAYTNFSELNLLERFGELEVLSVRRTAISDVGVLAGLDSLRSVDLRDCELLEPASLSRLRRLRPQLELIE